MAIKGSVIAYTDRSAVTHISFQLSNPSQTGEAISLAATDLIVTYIDDNQARNIGDVSDASTMPGWTALWLSGSGLSLDPGERVEMTVGLQSLDPRLGPSTEFVIQVQTNRGHALVVQRTTPAELTTVVDLK